MSFIIKQNNPFISAKLTDKGREMLAKGALNFTSWAIGDSEINYDREDVVTLNPTDTVLSGSSYILRPKDKQPNFKSYITKDGTTLLNPLQSSNIKTIKAIANNAAEERGFFDNNLNSYTISTGTTFGGEGGFLFPNTILSGGTSFPVTSGSGREDYFMLIKMSNDTIGTVTGETEPIPYLWYKVVADNGDSLELDRDLPNLNQAGSSTINYYLYPSTEVNDAFGLGSSSLYWDSGTLSFQDSTNVSIQDVDVWNMNNIWCETIAGTTGSTYEDFTKYGSYRYLGEKYPYFESACEGVESEINNKCAGLSEIDGTNKAISLIHYTNDTISNFYGEFFHIDVDSGKTLRLALPTIMYHRTDGGTASGTTVGLTLVASGDSKTLGTSDIEYYDLYENPDDMIDEAEVVGKVFPQLKMIAIEDEEIIAAMSYKSNRNWTLPPLATTLANPNGTGVLAQNETMYVTYTFENTSGTGLTTTLPCQKYAKITNSTSVTKDVEFRISNLDYLPYMRKIENGGYDGRGFHAYNFKVLYQIVADGEDRPDPTAWKVYDYTTSGLTTNVGETIDPKQLENQSPVTNGFVIDSTVSGASTTFSLVSELNMPPNASPESLQFGDERFFFGNITTYIGANIYKTLFGLTIDASQFQYTSNPTRATDGTNDSNLKVSEVGIYDNNNNLVVVGKTSEAIDLAAGNTIMIELSMDF
jgi:hypothetical protein